jgi:hypothetical protein
MMNGPATLTKVSAKTAAEVCQRFPLGQGSQKLLRPDLTPRQLLDLFIQHQQYLDAIRLLAYALPRREAVWWACLCARGVAGPNPPAKVMAALQAAEQWVSDPSDGNRRAALTAAEAAGFDTAAGVAAAAAFWSGGSLGPPNGPAVPPPEHLTAHGASGAIMLAAVQADPARAPEKYRRFLDLGIEVANGTNRWKEVPAKK